MSVREAMLAKMAAHRPGFSLDRAFYCDPDFYRLDLELVYHREWIFAGHDCEIAAPGAWFTLQVGDYPVVVVRGANGEIRAFHNTCRHRGSRVCTTDHGKSARLVCPYHQWTYDLDGKLLYAREQGEGFDPSLYRLGAVHCLSVAGYIFVCVAEQAPDPEGFRALAEEYWGPHKLADAKIAYESTIIERGNWKLVWENNRECYHCRSNHPELIRTFPETPAVTGVSGASSEPEITDHWAMCEARGFPSKFILDERGQYRATRVPLLRAAQSYTMSGEAAVKKPLVGDDMRSLGSCIFFHYPTTWNHTLVDSGLSFRVLPISATETQVTTKWLVHRDAVEGVDYDLTNLTEVWIATNDADRRIVEENQRGILSPAYQPGPYSTVQEGGVDQFVEWYLNHMRRVMA